MLAKSKDGSGMDQLIIIARVQSEIEATPIVAALSEEGIVATATGGFTAGFIAEAPGDIQIKIFEKDRELASKILSRIGAEGISIDWSKVDVGDPED
ncbi:MAG: DUF2007 domain-containing protein [Mariniblastus sp.]